MNRRNICPHSTLPKRNHSAYHADGCGQVAPMNLSQFCAAMQDTPKLNGCRPQGRVLTREWECLCRRQWACGVTLPHLCCLPPGTSSWPGHILFMVMGRKGKRASSDTQGLLVPRLGTGALSFLPTCHWPNPNHIVGKHTLPQCGHSKNWMQGGVKNWD